MKIWFQTLGVLAIASTVTFAEEAPKKEGKKKPDPAKAFAKLDTDSNGSISLDEFKASPKGAKDPAKAEKAFAKMDADSSGGISLEEFSAPPKPNHDGGGKKKKKDGQ